MGGVADGERQADRAERADRARGWKKRENAGENAGERAMAREGRSSEKGRRDDEDRETWSRLRERRMER